MKIGGMTLDINPISLEKTGTLEDYLKQADKYLDEKEIQKFAADLDAFAYRHDAYGYKDVIDNSDDSGIGAEAIRKDLMNGKIAPLREWLQELASGSVRVEDVVTAAQLRDRLEKIAEKQSEQTQPVPVYRLPFMEAQERGETDQWRASHWETKACAMEFNQDFGMAYHERRMPEFLQQMVDKYGMERCKIVLASTIQLADHDGRYYHSTKEEAAKVPIPNVDTSNENDRRLDYRADCHPVMVNSAFRELLTMEQKQSQEKAVSVAEQDEKAPKESVLNRLREKQKQVASQKEKPARVQDKKRGVEL
jgi:transposase